MRLRKPNAFTRRGRSLPGQSSDEDLGLERRLTIKVSDQAAVLNEQLIQIGDVSAGNYIELGPGGIKIFNQGTEVKIWADLDGSIAQTELQIQGIDASDPDAHIGLKATNHNSTKQVSFTMDTYADAAYLDVEQFIIGESIRLAGLTTSERNNLPQVNGTIVYNSTTGKFQGYTSGSWVDLH